MRNTFLLAILWKLKLFTSNLAELKTPDCSGLSNLLYVFENRRYYNNGSMLTFEQNVLMDAFDKRKTDYNHGKYTSSNLHGVEHFAENICHTKLFGILINQKITILTHINIFKSLVLSQVKKYCPTYGSRFRIQLLQYSSSFNVTMQMMMSIKESEYKTIFLLTNLEATNMILNFANTIGMNSIEYTWVFPLSSVSQISIKSLPNLSIGLRKAQFPLDHNATSLEGVNQNDKKMCFINSFTQKHNANAIFSVYALNRHHRWKQFAIASKDHFVQILTAKSTLVINSLFKTKVKVVTISEPPFTMIVSDAKSNLCEVGSLCISYVKVNGLEVGIRKCCVGYCMELLDRLKMDLNLDVELYFVRDSTYGDKSNQTWVGMVGDVAYDRADFIVAPLTINEQRSEVIDFAGSFMVGGVAMVTVIEKTLIPFLNLEPFKPLSNWLWVLIFSAMLFSSFCVFGLERLVEKSKGLSRYSMRMSLPYIAGLVFQRDQGGEEPVHLGSRVVAIATAIAMMVTMASYTAVLTANQVSYTTKLPVNGFKDKKIINPTKAFTYGTIENSAFTRLFRESKDPNWNRMYHFMKSYNFKDTDKAIEDLKSGKLNAIIHDYPVLYHYISKEPDCRINFAGDVIKLAGYGIAVKKGNPLKETINELILQYQNEGFLADLSKRWLNSKCVENNAQQSTAQEYTINYFGGLFFLLMGGVILAFLLFFIEHFIQKLKQCGKRQDIKNFPLKTKRNSRCQQGFSNEVFTPA